MEFENIFTEINQVSLLKEEIRFKLVLALFNSEVSVKGLKIGSASHSFNELKEITGASSSTDLSYHLKLLVSSDLIEKDKNKRGIYHITSDGKNILKKFGISKKLVQELAK